ncbi:MAG: 16S rRNA (cytosine(1402)-N(4))-methyltransferase RsmH [Brachybacterium sp.]|nr:16S rRNA (cytosine(1402)-N(4))-methyltransferase RsmH [Brachybacterium sp.]
MPEETTAPAQRHLPVLLQACIDLLVPALQRPGSLYVDATLGMGGHAAAILRAAPEARLLGIDRDAQALELARTRLTEEGFADRIDLVHTTYDRIPAVLADRGRDGADAILMDLGLSSFQIDTADRGFSYSEDAPLDMRMDTDADTPTAADLLRDLDAAQIADILHRYGDERFARRIASHIVRARQQQPLQRSSQLVALLETAVPAASRRTGGHPAKRTFQALRIAVNEELEILARALDGALDSLAVDGRIAIESYHSGEDRMVKNAFARRTRSSAPPGLPVELEEHRPTFEALTRGAQRADPGEIGRNSRAASVRLRAARRIRR